LWCVTLDTCRHERCTYAWYESNDPMTKGLASPAPRRPVLEPEGREATCFEVSLVALAVGTGPAAQRQQAPMQQP